MSKQSQIRSIFLRAAKIQHDRREFSCFSIERAVVKRRLSLARRGEIKDFYEMYFKPTPLEFAKMRGQGWDWKWWPNVNGQWDNESRVFALLLAAEIAQDIP